jgi:ribonuclease HI
MSVEINSLMKRWILHTDGACQPNPGAGGWAFILTDGNTEIVRRGIVPNTTNNRMEMQAVLEGIRYFLLEIGADDCRLRLVSDSKYIIKGITEWCDKWAKNNWLKKDDTEVLNHSFWKEIHLLKSQIDLECVHVRGHTGNESNERADQLAFEAAFKAKKFYTSLV